jgi:uncharacterized protein YciI
MRCRIWYRCHRTDVSWEPGSRCAVPFRCLRRRAHLDELATLAYGGSFSRARFNARTLVDEAACGSITPMFVIELVYKVDLAQIDAAMTAHVAWLKTHYDAGTFLVSGRKVPRDGGIVLALGHDRAKIEAIVRADPFVAGGLADYRIVEFRASQRADDVPKRVH